MQRVSRATIEKQESVTAHLVVRPASIVKVVGLWANVGTFTFFAALLELSRVVDMLGLHLGYRFLVVLLRLHLEVLKGSWVELLQVCGHMLFILRDELSKVLDAEVDVLDAIFGLTSTWCSWGTVCVKLYRDPVVFTSLPHSIEDTVPQGSLDPDMVFVPL